MLRFDFEIEITAKPTASGGEANLTLLARPPLSRVTTRGRCSAPRSARRRDSPRGRYCARTSGAWRAAVRWMGELGRRIGCHTFRADKRSGPPNQQRADRGRAAHGRVPEREDRGLVDRSNDDITVRRSGEILSDFKTACHNKGITHATETDLYIWAPRLAWLQVS